MQTNRPVIETTADGSHTLFVPEMNEHYHSVNGARQESVHVFIEAGLRQSASNDISLLEIGFGTGLNAYLSLIEAAEKGIRVHYTTLELYPLQQDIIEKLNYGKLISEEHAGLFDQLHRANWDEEVSITPFFTLCKVKADLCNYTFVRNFDVVFFDAFAPDKQPEMWNPAHFEQIFSHCNPGAIFTTYCAKGTVRRALLAAGFDVERIPGPPGKRQMLRARRP